MGIDPIRSRNNPVAPAHLRLIPGRPAVPAAPVAEPNLPPAEAPDPSGSAASPPVGEAPPRVDLVRARIAADYYGQAHVRDRILRALLQFLDE